MIKNLPTTTMEQIKETLKAYAKCNVVFENGQYQVRTGHCLLNEYAKDYQFIQEVTAAEIFTETELIENYINVFASYPADYKGKRDYAMLNKIEDEKSFDYENNTYTTWVGKINENGNFELTQKITKTM